MSVSDPLGIDLPKRIDWSEPVRFSRQRVWRSFRATEFVRVRMWIWATTIAAVFLVAVTVVSLQQYPGIQMPWTKLLLGLVFGVPTIIGVYLLLHMFLPDLIQVHRELIHIQSRDTHTQIHPQQMRSLALDLTSLDEPGLVIEWNGRSGRIITRRYVDSPDVNLNDLSALVDHLQSQIQALADDAATAHMHSV